MTDRPPQDTGPTKNEPPVWRRRWFQLLLGATVVFVFLSFVLPPVLSLIYALRSVLTPVVFALVLAYIFNPVVTFLDKRVGLPRWGGSALIMATGALLIAVSLFVAVPMLVEQGSSLLLKLQDVYPRVLASLAEEHVEPIEEAAQALDTAAQENGASETTIEIDEDDSAFARLLASEPVQKMLRAAMEAVTNLEWSTIATTALRTMDIGTSVLGSAISATLYWLLFVMVATFSFFFLSWKLGEFMNWFVPYIPVDHRERTMQILKRMDRTVSAWLRGRLMQAVLQASLLTIGWGITGVPYWFLLGVVSLVLGLVPYLIAAVWVVALVLSSLDAFAASQFTIWVLIWPTVVYLIVQAIDGWVAEPLLQGQATEMNTLTVLLVVMAGGVLGGVLGLLIAIPVAACVKILCAELLLPRLRELAAQKSAG